jgi:PKD repeat protein
MKTLRLICLLVLLLPAFVQAQVQCFSSASLLQGCPPLPVTFTDLSTGNPTNHYWDYDDGTTTTQQNPSKVFTNPGVYNVKHRVSNGTSVDSCYVQIHVFAPPTVNFTSPDARGCVYPCHTVHFQNLTVTGESSIINYTWNWGDGTMPVTLNTNTDTTHCYTTVGSYAVTLVARDSNTCQSTKTINMVKIGQQPSVTASANLTQSCTSPVVIGFTANGSTPNGGPLSYAWYFCNGSASALQNPQSVFFNSSCCSRVVITDTLGCTDTAVVCTEVTQVQAGFDTTFISNGCAKGVQFTDISNYAASWLWNFGDGTTSTQQNPFHSYSSAGSYTVTLTVSYNGCIDTETKLVTVTGTSSLPTAGFTYSITGCSGQIQFTDTTFWSAVWLWSFGDGTTSTQQNPLHTYTQPGTYTVSLTITSGICSTTVSRQVVYNGAAADFFVLSAFAPCPPFPVQFYNTGDTSFNYQWNFGDGYTSTKYEPLHVYLYPGKYKITLIVSDSTGNCADTIEKTDFIRVNGPIGNFSLSPDSGAAPLTVTITGTILNTSSYVVDMGDGVTFPDSLPGQYTYTITDPHIPIVQYTPVVQLTDTLGCTVAYIVDTVICTGGVGVEDFSDNRGFKLYPNPAVETLVIELAEETDTRLHVYNMLGQEVLNTALSNKTTLLNIAHLPKGIYRISVVEYGRIPTGSLFIKQ